MLTRFSKVTTSVFAAIVIVLGALLENFIANFLDGIIVSYAGLGIATGVLTLLTLPPMFVSFSFFFSPEVF